jgi:D-arabinose 1-dehydrogenase-like Zn-dependent alcohol dehydrogenase
MLNPQQEKAQRMKALMLEAYEHLQVIDMPVPAVAADEVLIKVAACGICGSDVHGYDGGSGRRIPPIVMGHEAAGIIAAVGSDVQGYKAGDRVTFDSTVYCGKCEFCKRGEVNLCDNRQVMGVSCGDYRRHGAFAEFVAVPERILYKLPENFPFEEAAMLEAVAVALHGVRVSQLKPGDSVLVIGAGMIGLLTAQAARLPEHAPSRSPMSMLHACKWPSMSVSQTRCIFRATIWLPRSCAAPAISAWTLSSKQSAVRRLSLLLSSAYAAEAPWA